ncbi:MAG: DUF2752 domain-containing protein [Balneolaceae bacterium]
MRFINKHLEWVVFSIGLILLGIMNPENFGTSLCLFEFAGIDFCPGEGLGHSIAYTFRGDFSSAMKANMAGPAAILILSLRILHIWQTLYNQSKHQQRKDNHG